MLRAYYADLDATTCLLGLRYVLEGNINGVTFFGDCDRPNIIGVCNYLDLIIRVQVSAVLNL